VDRKKKVAKQPSVKGGRQGEIKLELPHVGQGIYQGTARVGERRGRLFLLKKALCEAMKRSKCPKHETEGQRWLWGAGG